MLNSKAEKTLLEERLGKKVSFDHYNALSRRVAELEGLLKHRVGGRTGALAGLGGGGGNDAILDMLKQQYMTKGETFAHLEARIHTETLKNLAL